MQMEVERPYALATFIVSVLASASLRNSLAVIISRCLVVAFLVLLLLSCAVTRPSTWSPQLSILHTHERKKRNKQSINCK